MTSGASEIPHFDVLVIGAGLSGIAAAYYLKTRCPTRSFAVLEARDSIGGTWDLFRYPGVRSDSDMQTLGFSFYPWKNPREFADGPAIMEYLRETIEEFELEPYLRFGTRLLRASWSSEADLWTLTCVVDGQEAEYVCRFLWGCTGYYSYEEGHDPDFAGRDRFGGVIAHPQFWPEDLDWTDKRVTVIGSGATAVTVVPEMAKTATRVTMLQRSPSYVLSLPMEDRFSYWAERLFGRRIGATLTRWKNILRIMLYFNWARWFPELTRRSMIDDVRKAVGPDVDVDVHFSPPYAVWDQRVCFVPDGDLFKSIRSGAVRVVTDRIDTFTETGIALESGEHIDADIIVTATGLKVQVLGGTEVLVDGEVLRPQDHWMYKGTMLDGVPNAVMSVGYTNASWTLKCELISRWFCRLLNHMEERGQTRCVPRAPEGLPEERLIDFNSGYVERAIDILPKQGAKAPWRLYQNYFLDSVSLSVKAIEDGVLELR